MIDLLIAYRLCSEEYEIMIDGTAYIREDIPKKFDMRKVKIGKIYFDRWHGCLRFETANYIERMQKLSDSPEIERMRNEIFKLAGFSEDFFANTSATDTATKMQLENAEREDDNDTI